MVKKPTRIARFIAAVENRPVFVGLDVHKKTYSVAIFEPQDGLVETWTCPAGEDALAAQLAGLGCPIEHVVYESGPTGFALAPDGGNAVSVSGGCRARGLVGITDNKKRRHPHLPARTESGTW